MVASRKGFSEYTYWQISGAFCTIYHWVLDLPDYGHILARLTELLQATNEPSLLQRFAEAITDAGGTAFALVFAPSAKSTAGSAPCGLIGLTEYFDLTAERLPNEMTKASLRPLFWSDVRIEGVHAVGHFILDSAGEFSIAGLIAPMPRPEQGGSIFVRIGMEQLGPEMEQHLTMLCMAFHARLGQLRSRQQAVAADLSERELQVLHWLAEGKSAEDVAEILGVSPATVMFHYRNVAVRYGTLNRTHTIVEAVRRGALQLS